MEEIKELTKFYSAILKDPRIGTAHISVYMALFQVYNLNRFENPLKISRSSLMASAKINGLATYHRCIKDLAAYGYIQYTPSYTPSICSQVVILKL